jgi:hypothetical protein
MKQRKKRREGEKKKGRKGVPSPLEGRRLPPSPLFLPLINTFFYLISKNNKNIK